MPRKKKQNSDAVAPSTTGDDYIFEAQQTPQSETLEIPYSEKLIHCLRYNPSAIPPEMIFTHGAGGTLDAPAMVNFAAGFAASKSLLYFQGSMNLKSRTKMFHAVVQFHESSVKALGGRSMGARAAVMAAHEDRDVKALILVSYPLKSEKGDLRDQILLDLDGDVEVLFISGDRDNMCSLIDLDGVRRHMKAKSWLITAKGADHGLNMKPKKATDVLGRLTGELAAKWLDGRDMAWTESTIGWDDERVTIFQSSWETTQRHVSNTGEDHDPPPRANTVIKKVDPKDSAKKSSGKREEADKTEIREGTRSQKRKTTADTAMITATRTTRPKRPKKG